MRVITGSARGRKLLSPVGKDVRPTAEMTKEAMFSVVQFELENAFVLDLFSGSGQLGIEALSRGARFCVFVDSARDSQELTRENLKNTRLFEKSRVVSMDYLAFLKTTQDRFDIALLDPPYDTDFLEKALPLLAEKMTPAGVILCETDRRCVLPQGAGEYALAKEYRYGKAKVALYRRTEAPQGQLQEETPNE